MKRLRDMEAPDRRGPAVSEVGMAESDRRHGTFMKSLGSTRVGRSNDGFSLLELMMVVAIMLVVAAYAIPIWTTAIRPSRIRGAETAYAGLLQMARTRRSTTTDIIPCTSK